MAARLMCDHRDRHHRRRHPQGDGTRRQRIKDPGVAVGRRVQAAAAPKWVDGDVVDELAVVPDVGDAAVRQAGADGRARCRAGSESIADVDEGPEGMAVEEEGGRPGEIAGENYRGDQPRRWIG